MDYGECDGFLAVFRFGAEIVVFFAFEKFAEQLANHLAIVGNQNGFGHERENPTVHRADCS